MAWHISWLVETIPRETPSEFGFVENPSSQRACSRGAPKMGYMRNSDSYVPHIFFSHKSVPSSTIPTFSPRVRKLRNVKTEQRHLGEYNLRQFSFFLGNSRGCLEPAKGEE